MKLKFVSFSQRFWRYARIGSLTVVCAVALGAIGVSYEMWHAEGIIRDATRDLNLGRTGEARRSLEVLSKSASYGWFLKLHLVSNEELMRVQCAATVADAEYEKAVDVCTRALSSTTNPAVQHELYFNRAAAYIGQTVSGTLAKGMSRAIDDYKMDLRTELHSRAAVVLEKLNLFKAGQGKGDPKKGGDGESRPGVPMFDESPSNGGGGGIEEGY